MNRSESEPPVPLSLEELLACAKEAGVAIPAEQSAGVLAGAQRLREAATRLRAFLTEEAR